MEADTGVALGITQLVLYGSAAAYGFVQASRCSALRSEVLERESRGESVEAEDSGQPRTWSPVLKDMPRSSVERPLVPIPTTSSSAPAPAAAPSPPTRSGPEATPQDPSSKSFPLEP